MKVVIGSDHAGYSLKEAIKKHLEAAGHEVMDKGTNDTSSCHYPIYAEAVANAIVAGEAERGVLVCGTGIGMSMVANKYRGIRAAVCGDTFSAKMTRIHNNANVLCMGARVIGQGLAVDITDMFLENEFESGGRHELRVNMITDVEKDQYNCK